MDSCNCIGPCKCAVKVVPVCAFACTSFQIPLELPEIVIDSEGDMIDISCFKDLVVTAIRKNGRTVHKQGYQWKFSKDRLALDVKAKVLNVPKGFCNACDIHGTTYEYQVQLETENETTVVQQGRICIKQNLAKIAEAC